MVPPAAFEALAEGHTLHFTLDGAPFGAEQYFPGRRTLWRYADGLCAEGRWWGSGDSVCFAYDDVEGAQCWRFTRAGSGLAADLVEGGDGPGFELQLAQTDDARLPCPGPKVGT